MNILSIYSSFVRARTPRRIAIIVAGALLALAAATAGAYGIGTALTSAQQGGGGIAPEPGAGLTPPQGFEDPARPGALGAQTLPPIAPEEEEQQQDPLGIGTPAAPGGNIPEATPPAQPAAVPETATGFGGYGLISGVHYPPNRLIIRYKENPVSDSGQASELEALLEGLEPQHAGVSVSEAQAVAQAVAQDLLAVQHTGISVSDVEVTGGVSERNTYFVSVDHEFDPLEASLALNALDNVEYAHPDYYIEPAQTNPTPWNLNCYDITNVTTGTEEADPCAGGGEPLRPVGNGRFIRHKDWYIENINLDAAQEFAQQVRNKRMYSSDHLVAILDTAVWEKNPELKDRWHPLAQNLYDSRIDSITADPRSRSYGVPDLEPFHQNSGTLSHGDIVANLLAGKKDNGYGAYGVYQSNMPDILPLQIFPDNVNVIPTGDPSHGLSGISLEERRILELGLLSAAIEAVKVADHAGAKVINGSFNTLGHNPSSVDACSQFSKHSTINGKGLRDAIEAFDGIYVASAGNSVDDRSSINRALGFDYISVPQAFAQDVRDISGNVCLHKLPNIINVAGTRQLRNYIFQPERVQLLLSSYRSPDYVQLAAPGQLSNNLEGSSYAAPLVAGTAALMLMVNSDVDGTQTAHILNFTGRRDLELVDRVTGGKTLDALAAVSCAHELKKVNLKDISEAEFIKQLRSICAPPEFGFQTISSRASETIKHIPVYIGLKDGAPPAYDIPLRVQRSGSANPSDDYYDGWKHWNHEADRWSGWKTWDGTIVFPAGETWTAFMLHIHQDDVSDQGSETLDLTLSAPYPGNAAVQEGTNRFTHTIVDSPLHAGHPHYPPQQELRFGITETSVTEDQQYVHLTVEDSYSGDNLRLHWGQGSATAGRDYAVGEDGKTGWEYWDGQKWMYEPWGATSPHNFRFSSSTQWAEYRIRITDDDDSDEGDESFNLRLDRESGSSSSSQLTYTILDNDAQPSAVPNFGFSTNEVNIIVDEAHARPLVVTVLSYNGVAPLNDIPLHVSIHGFIENIEKGWRRINKDGTLGRFERWIENSHFDQLHSFNFPAGQTSAQYVIKLLNDDGAAIRFTLSPPNPRIATVHANAIETRYYIHGSSGLLSQFGFRHASADGSETQTRPIAYLDLWDGPVPTETITLDLTWEGSATPGVDYIRGSETITIPRGATGVEIPISVIDDGYDDRADETVTLNLAASSPGVSVSGGRGTFTYTILDDDPLGSPEFGFREASGTGLENEIPAYAHVELKRGSVPTQPVTLDLIWETGTAAQGAATRGMDYDTVTTTSVTFQAGEVSKAIRIPVRDDNVRDEGHETITISLPESVTAQGAIGSFTYTIRDDDIPMFQFAMEGLTLGATTIVPIVLANDYVPTSNIILKVEFSGSAIYDSDYRATLLPHVQSVSETIEIYASTYKYTILSLTSEPGEKRKIVVTLRGDNVAGGASTYELTINN